tara:strand:- start:106 stop:1317 length:1212 start_codon:yes stop_codon:yes gene_type:complete
MAKKKKEEVVEKTTKKTEVNEPKGKETKGDVTKVKTNMKMKPEVVGETITKVDLNKPEKPEENEVKEDNTNNEGVVTELKNAEPVQEQKEVQPEAEAQETPVIEEITQEEKVEKVADKVEQAIEVAEQTGTALPEGIQKVVDFMQETGGDLNDYVKLNQDYSEMDSQTVLQEYYKQTKPHLTVEERNFLMDDEFSYDEDEHSETEIKRKKLALKEQVANARAHLDGQKSKYYEEIKSGSKLTNEQQEAINFYNEAQQKAKFEEDITDKFLNKTNKFFGDEFKGFEYSVGEKKFRLNVSDTDKVKKSQSDINNFITKFVDENYNMTDPSGYHKGLYTAMNPDIIANHFYEQGKADALKESVEKAKNVDMAPRQTMNPELNAGGIKVRALGNDANDFKFKIKNRK